MTMDEKKIIATSECKLNHNSKVFVLFLCVQLY